MRPSVSDSGDGAGRPAGIVLIVDDHELVRELLAEALRARGVAAHSCSTTTVPEICAVAARYAPGLVLLDLNLGTDDNGTRIDSTDAVIRLRAMGWTVLLLSGTASHRQARIAASVAAGAIGQLSKSGSFDALVDSLTRAAAGIPVMTTEEKWRWHALHRQLTADAQRRSIVLAQLSVRERLVLDRLAEGHRAAEIAVEFGVSVSTVRSHIRSILTKLNVSSQLGAVALVRDQETLG